MQHAVSDTDRFVYDHVSDESAEWRLDTTNQTLNLTLILSSNPNPNPTTLQHATVNTQ